MAVSSKTNALFSRIKPFLSLQKFKHTLIESSVMEQEKIDMSKWRKMDSYILGISRSMISESSWIVLKVLQSAGYEAYLVGGCVRDMLLNKVPKDFDVITTAALKQVKRKFHRCLIVGTRFPICLVQVKGYVVEVSSFETVAQHNKGKAVVSVPRGCDMKDYARWRNSMLRDFTVNSLFFDPFERKVYDYANGMMDLKSLKLRTLIPAHLSFKEDCARILRGLRLAARLGLSLSQDIEIAIQRLVPSIASLPKARLMMEMNYMLSYGASGPSLSILQKFNLLEILLPLQARYLSQQARNNQNSVMLMKLFYNLDKLVTCNQPSDCNLWVGLLAFHLALMVNPQDALVVCTFASVLYRGNWIDGVKFGRVHAHRPTVFTPEITQANHLVSDIELAERVTRLASEVQYCIGSLSHSDNLLQLLSRFPDSPHSGLVFVPYKSQKRASDLFYVLEHDVENYMKERNCFDINYTLLGKGDMCETRFVLGKIIVDTMSSGAIESSEDAVKKHELVKSNSEDEFKVLGNITKKRDLPINSREQQKDTKKKKLILEESVSEDENAVKRNKAANTEFDTLAKLEVKVIETNKEAMRHMFEVVKNKEHPEFGKENRQEVSESKMEQVKKKVIEKSKDVEGKKQLDFEEEKQPEVAEAKIEPIKKKNKEGKGKKHPDFEKEKGQGGSEAKTKLVKKVIEKNKKGKGKEHSSFEKEKQQDKSETKMKPGKKQANGKSKQSKDKEHPKFENQKQQEERSEAETEPIKNNIENVISSVGKCKLPLEKKKKLEKVSENSDEDKNKKPNGDVKGEKHKPLSLSSLFRR